MKKVLLTVLITVCCLFANAQWSDDPAENNRITPLATEVYDHELKVSGDGTSFVVFNRPTGGIIATFLQIIDVNGNMLFSDEGMLISDKPTSSMTSVNQLLFVDDDGNAIISVSDFRNVADYYSYALYKVSPTGEMLWGEDGIDLCGGMGYGFAANMNITQLEDGSYVCAWVVEGSSVYIQLQKVSKTGELLWDETVTRIADPSALMVWYPYLVNAGDNQVIVVYMRATSLFNGALKARKFDSNGSSVWTDDLTVCDQVFVNSIPIWVIVRVIPDQMGGAFVGWWSASTGNESTYVAHVTTNGTLGFDGVENGMQVGHNNSLKSYVPEMYFDKTEGFLYVAFRETNSTQSYQQISAQKVKVSSGELMWNPNGVEIAPYANYSISFYTIQDGGDNKAAVFFTSNTYDPVYFYEWDINNITLINSDGEYVWDDEIIEFSNPVGFKSDVLSTPLMFNAFWLTAWGDERKIDGDPSGKNKIYMQRINLDGTLGDNGGICFPPTNVAVASITEVSAVVSWEGAADDYELSYCIAGEEWSSIDVIGAHTFTLENLTPDTDYQVRVRSICSTDQTSVWSATIDFTTLDTPPPPPCETPVNLNVTEITTTSARLSWEAGNDENLSWDLRYNEAIASTPWNDIQALEVKTYLLEQLTPNTAYLWTVRANCSEDRTSEWAAENDFTTAPDSVGINNVTKDRMTVYASGQMINVINPENRYIERIQIFSINGRLLSDYTIKSAGNVLIPSAINDEMMVVVKIVGESEEESYKIVKF